MRTKLTKRSIDAAKYPKPSHAHSRAAHYLWDSEVAGFGLRVYPSGRKSFLATYRTRGKQRFFTIGRFGELTVHQARTEALQILARARQGEDPAAERMGYHNAPTVQDLKERFMSEHAHATKKPKSIRSDEARWKRYILPKLSHRRVADLTREDIQVLRSELSDRPPTFNAVRSLLSTALNLAELWGWRPEGSNPCRHIKPFKVSHRERYLSQQELVRLSHALSEAEDAGTMRPQSIAAFRLLLVTGCRYGEIRTLRWAEVDFERHCLRLEDSKTGAKMVYLNSAALQVLADIDRDPQNPYVLPGAKPGEPIKNLRIDWQKIRSATGLEDVRLHDLRHTFASFGVNMGLSLQVVGKLLGHHDISTTQIYAHLADDPIRHANERIGQEIAALMAGQPKASIISFTT